MSSFIIGKKFIFFVFVYVGLSLISEKVHAVCGLSIAANNITTTWDLSWTLQAVSITLDKTNPAACTFGLGFSKGGAGSYTRYALNGALQLNYQLYNDNGAINILKDAPDTVTVNDVVMVTLPAGSGPQIVQYFFDIPYALATAPFLAHAGTYTDSFTINAYEGADPSLYLAPPDASAPVNLTITIEKLINLSMVDLGNIYQDGATTKAINFGRLTTGEVSRFNIALRTNAGFSVTVTSANAGNLKHVTKNSLVPYTLFINGVLADLTGVVPVVSGGGQTSLSGLIYPVKIVIGAVGNLPAAGNYADVVTVTAIVTE